MTFTTLQLPFHSIPDEVGSIFAGLKYRFDPVKSPLRKSGLHIFGPHFFSSHVDFSHMRY